jgi:tetratricopeptide (TPR) repeat protein
LAVLFLPLFFLLAVELTLRLFGFRYPTHFFDRLDSGPRNMFAENQKFGWRFFPRRLARAPDPIRVSKIKPPGSYRVFVFGESAALGDPEPAYGFSRMLRELLEARCPGTQFEVINTGMTAINSHAILQIAGDCVPFQGDVWILYMGNNEVVGPFGAGSVFGSKAPPLAIIRTGLAAKRTAIGQMLDALWERGAPANARRPAQWEGMKMMLDERIRPDDPILERVQDHFSRNLQDILSIAARVGAKSIVCSVSSNLKDCPPFASLNRPGLSDAMKAQWERLLSSGAELEGLNDWDQALAHFQQAAEIDDSYAALAFRMARCYLALGQVAAAREQFARARDLDTLRFRADTRLNRIIRDLCASRRAEGVTFFDSEQVVSNLCKQGIAGEECFWDHVHFNFSGNYAIASGLADQVLASLPEPVRRSAESGGTILTENECAERLAFTDWDQRLVLGQMARRMQEPPFTSQLDHETSSQRRSALVTALDQKLDRQGLARAAETYRAALARRPDDWILHDRFGALLEASGDLVGAAQHWQIVMKIVPERVETCFKLGEISARQGRPIDAEIYFRRVLGIRPTSFEAMNGLGLLRMESGNFEEAIRFFEQALTANPKFAEAHVNWGLTEYRRGNAGLAEAHYREALRCNAGSVAANVNLGNLLAAQQKHAEAIDHYVQALNLRSNEATVHFALANSLAAVGRNSEAVARFQEAIRLNPALAEAHFNLGVALAKQGDLSAATTAFQQASRLNPGDSRAHFNLGVALAKQSRWSEAADQFRAVLSLDPGNAAASQYLQTAMAKDQLGP